ncbi:MAG TPA: pectin acetylesterase-family hydrolase [Myxococcaceae bacterium]|nr:pectin acetylesterase-family hydrolase [Myxococcaceae bacterium]
MIPRALPMVVMLASLVGCGPGTVPAPPDGPGPDGGFGPEAGEVDVGGGWSWLAVDGTRCARGARSGLALQRGGDGTDLFVYVQGGGACWNEGTCAPSYRTNGPLCYYNPNSPFCPNETGGMLPTSSYVDVADPFPANGGANLAHELSVLTPSAVFDRERADNPFREASFVYVPYCTGDLHTGKSERTYRTQKDGFSPVVEHTHHFAGATNMERSIEVLQERFPNVERIWLFGVSAGGYGATFHHGRFRAAFPDAEVHLLADSSPFIQPRHWDDWVAAWDMALPEGCATCAEGLPQVMGHVLSQADAASARVGLLAYERDATVAWFFLAEKGAGPFINPGPTLDAYQAGLGSLLPLYDLSPASGYFILPGEQHVMLPGYGYRQGDGTYTAPYPAPDGSTDLAAWIDAWAVGDAFPSIR